MHVELCGGSLLLTNLHPARPRPSFRDHRREEPTTPASSTFERGKPKEMPQKGFEEMDKRADAVGSSWRVYALATFGVITTKLLMSRIGGLFGKKSRPEDTPK